MRVQDLMVQEFVAMVADGKLENADIEEYCKTKTQTQITSIVEALELESYAIGLENADVVLTDQTDDEGNMIVGGRVSEPNSRFNRLVMACKLVGGLFPTQEGKEQQKGQKEPQQETHKPTRGKGRPKETLKDKMINDADGEKWQKIHDVWGESKGKDASLIIVACIKMGWMKRPTYTQVKDEFGDIGSKTGYNHYLDSKMFSHDEIEGIMNILKQT